MAARALKGDMSELRQARAMRLEADRNLQMSQRLSRLHTLCRQISAIKGAARTH